MGWGSSGAGPGPWGSESPPFEFVLAIEGDSEIDNKGGARLVLSGDFPDRAYTIHVGPLGTAGDPAVYSGVPGQGNVIKVEDGKITFGAPTLPTGGPYFFFLVPENPLGPSARTSQPLLTVRNHNIDPSAFDLRRLLPPTYRTGPRSAEREPLQ